MNDNVEDCIGVDPGRDERDDLECAGADIGKESKVVELKDEDEIGLAPSSPRLCPPRAPFEELVRTVDNLGDEGKDCTELCICEACAVAGGGDAVGENPGDCIAGVYEMSKIRARKHWGRMLTYSWVFGENTTPNIILPVLRRVNERVGLHCSNVAITDSRRVADQTLEVDGAAQRSAGTISGVSRSVLDPL